MVSGDATFPTLIDKLKISAAQGHCTHRPYIEYCIVTEYSVHDHTPPPFAFPRPFSLAVALPQCPPAGSTRIAPLLAAPFIFMLFDLFHAVT